MAPDLGSFESAAIIVAPGSSPSQSGRTERPDHSDPTSLAEPRGGTSKDTADSGISPSIRTAVTGVGLGGSCFPDAPALLLGCGHEATQVPTSRDGPGRVGQLPAVILQFLAWFCVALIAYLSLIPDDMEVRTAMPPGLEHAVAYAGTMSLLAIAYPTWSVLRITTALAAYSGLMEFLQMFSHGRHPGLDGVVWSSGGALVAGQLIKLYRKWHTSNIARGRFLPG